MQPRASVLTALAASFLALAQVGCSDAGIPPGDPDAIAPYGDASGDGSSNPDGGNPPNDGGNPPTGDAEAGGPSPVCLGKQPGAYCGNDSMQNADPSTLYQCPGPNQAPTSSMFCKDGCVVAPMGMADYCKPPVVPNTYKLPWHKGTSMQLTQDCNDACCADHVGNDQWAWDFANGGGFTIAATRGGTITHLKINSTTGCGNSSCANDANFIVIDHGDGTMSTYLHLAGNSLKQGITCGAQVVQGQDLATAGTTGWSTGVHLHYQVSKVHNGAPTCECGANGTGCAANNVPWANFWVNATYPSQSINFVEWPASSQCANRRIAMPASQN